jgi:endonuclease G
MSGRQKKHWVLSRRGLDEPGDEERRRVREAIEGVPDAEISADFGPILQVRADPARQLELESVVGAMDDWNLSDEGEVEMPSPLRIESEKEDEMPPMTSKLQRVPGFRFAPPPDEGEIARVKLTLDDPRDYDDREGFNPDFLGVGVPLPALSQAQTNDAVERTHGTGIHLHYWNFTTVQSRSRRLPFFSAANVDGKLRRKFDRSDVWRFDPRIPTEFQILKECYGSDADGFFSRGHMTRREDPVWGENAAQAEEDTFLATNAVPQMQKHNGKLWLSLEDFVLKNATTDRQKVCVITGPVFGKNDPIIHGVKIPVFLWKIIAFIHDETGELAATAYRSSQAEFLPDTGEGAFVWGQFKRLQVPVSRIARDTGLDFGPLEKADVLSGAPASFAIALESEADIVLA